MLSNLISKLFICSCSKNHGVKNVKQLGNHRVVGRCLKCGKRSYGQIITCSDFVQKASEVKNGK